MIDQLLIGKVSDEHSVGVWSGADVVKLDCRRAVSQHAFGVLNRFELRFARVARERVGIGVETHGADLLEERFFTGRDDQGRAFGHVSANAAGVIVVMMRDGDVLDRFVGNRFSDLFDRLLRDAIVAGRFHHEDVIVEVNEEDVVAAGARRVDLFSVSGDWCWLREGHGAHSFRDFEGLGLEIGVEGDIGEAEVVCDLAVDGVEPARRNDVVADFALIGEARFENGVAGEAIGAECFEFRELGGLLIDVEGEPRAFVADVVDDFVWAFVVFGFAEIAQRLAAFECV